MKTLLLTFAFVSLSFFAAQAQTIESTDSPITIQTTNWIIIDMFEM